MPTAWAQADTPPAFPSQVSLVTVDAVVVDATGQSVLGLTQEDFRLEEDGQPQTIVNFEAVTVPLETAAAATTPADSRPIVTNAAAEAKTGRAFAIVADDLSFPGEQSLQIRQTLARFINESLGRGDTAIVGTTSGDTWWKERLPEGRGDLLAVVDRVKGRYADPRLREHMTEYEAYWITHREGGTAQRSEKLTDAMQRPSSVSERVVLRMWEENLCGRKDGRPESPASADACWPIMRATASDIDATRSQRTSQTLQAMSRALAALSPSQGRKSLVFVSPGFIQDNDLPLQDIASAALQAHTSLYFVDARGLVAEAGGGSAAERTRQSPAPDRMTATRLEDLELASGGAQALAEQTGGFSVRNTNDLAGAATRIAAESRTYYLLGFAPPLGKAPTAWRKLRVEVKRSGVTTRARRGYRLDQATAAAMTRTGPDTTIPLRMATYLLEPAGGDRTRVVAVTEIDTAGLAAKGSPDETNPALKLRLEATPRDGGQPQVQDVSLQSAGPSPQAGARTGSNWRLARLEFPLTPGIHAIRAFVQDPVSGRTGVVEQRLEVPSRTGLRLSTPVLSDQVTASRDATSPPFPAPVAHDQFKADPGRPLLATVEVFGAAKDAATGKTDVLSRFVLQTRAGQALAAPPASPLAASPDGRLRQVVALPPLPGGDYDLVIAVEDRMASASQEVHRTFRVEGPNASATGPVPSAPTAAPPVTNPELAAILERAGQYVLAYGRDFSNIAAEEECRQIFEPNDPGRRAVRNTRAGAFFVTLPGPLPWATFRDVWEVDGNKVHERGEGLGLLFKDSPVTARERARTMLEESARYNLGPVRRTLNIPTLALLFLHPDNQRRFAFELKGKPGAPVVEVAFSERGRPTLVAGDTSEGAPVKGRVWIDREHGTVMKTDAEYDIDPRDTAHRSRARIVTEYRMEPALKMLVPDRMKETYTSLAAQGQQRGVLSSAHARIKDPQEESGVFTTEATTSYTAYARFEVTTNETFTPKKPE